MQKWEMAVGVFSGQTSTICTCVEVWWILSGFAILLLSNPKLEGAKENIHNNLKDQIILKKNKERKKKGV